MNEAIKITTEEEVMDIISSAYDFEEVVVSSSTNSLIKRGLLETLFNVIVKNTAEKDKVTKEKLYEMRKSLVEFEASTEIVICEYKDKSNGENYILSKKIFRYSPSMSITDIDGWVVKTSALIETIVKNEIWYEDGLYNGFCCKGKYKNNYFRITHNNIDE